MKFVADENLGVQVPQFLRGLGVDIISVTEISPGKTDIEVLQICNQEERVLVTLDKDFGELVFKLKLAHQGVILLRFKDESLGNKKKILLKALKSKKNFQGKFTVISDKRVRN